MKYAYDLKRYAPDELDEDVENMVEYLEYLLENDMGIDEEFFKKIDIIAHRVKTGRFTKAKARMEKERKRKEEQERLRKEKEEEERRLEEALPEVQSVTEETTPEVKSTIKSSGVQYEEIPATGFLRKPVALLGLAVIGILVFGAWWWSGSDDTGGGYVSKESAAPAATLETLTSPTGIEFVLIPAGEFDMGSPSSEKNGDSDEGPVHRVKISKPFYLGKYEATQKQWRDVMGNNPSGFSGCDACPVEEVSWDDVQEFIRKLNEKEGTGKYRLPTEAEWEYAARAGTKTAYSFGDDGSKLGDYAWYSGNSGGKTHPVGQKKPNSWGLYDMHGNVDEWVQDWYDPDYYKNSPSVDPQGSSSGFDRVNRGGSWSFDARYCRSALRRNAPPGNNYNGVGFRLAMSLQEENYKDKTPAPTPAVPADLDTTGGGPTDTQTTTTTSSTTTTTATMTTTTTIPQTDGVSEKTKEELRALGYVV